MRVDVGDSVQPGHLSTCQNKPKYTSHCIRNEFILVCENILCDQNVQEV